MALEDVKVLHQFGAATIAAPSRVIPTMAFTSSVKTRKTDIGTNVIEGIRIFKVGTFADSMGIVRTWEKLHLEMMVAHFNLLKDNSFFPNVPVRVDHSASAEAVVGYFVKVYMDPNNEEFLAADIEITEPDAFAKWERGTFRSRSLEVGMYETNGENAQTYFPVVMGLAFVDIPAVEGLHAKSAPGTFSQALQDNPKETKVNDEEFMKACAYAEWLDAANYAQACEDWESAANYAQACEDLQEQAEALGLNVGNPPATHAATSDAITFSVQGKPVTMTTAEMGQQLGNLLTFRQETIDGSRRTFVDDLAKYGKIAQIQVDSMKGVVVSMDDAQFDAFKLSYEAAPTSSLFGQYGNNGGDDPTPSGQGGTTAEQIADLEEIVANHRRRGANAGEIENLASYKKLQTLKGKSA